MAQRGKVTEEDDKRRMINRNNARQWRRGEREKLVENYDLERSVCNEEKDGSRGRGPMREPALHWQNNQLSRKVWKATGIRSTVSALGSKADFCDQFRKGRISESRDRNITEK